MPTYPAATLIDAATRMFVAAGASTDVAAKVSELLVWSERVGHSSHGLLRIPTYLRLIKEGRIVPDADPVVVRETDTTMVIDGSWGFGQIVATRGVELGIDKAGRTGMAAVGAFHINHVGRLGDFTEQGARAGLITLACVGGVPTGAQGNVVPFGGRKAVWGTNPLAIAIPAADRIFSLDFATSAVAYGKVASALARGVDLDGEYLVDRDGRPTRDPHALMDGGAILPFGGHKGYALAFAVELMAGALIGAAADDLELGEMHNGLFLMLIDPGSLGSVARFDAATETVLAAVRSCPPANGFEEVMVPGEPEQRRLSESDRTGIDVPMSVIEELNEAALGLAVELSW